MKILLIAENPAGPFGGIERHCYNICKMFCSSEVEVQMASIESIENRTIFNKRFFKKKSLKRTIIDSNCDIVHVHGFANFTVWQSLLVALNVRKKVVYTPHFHPFNALEKPILGRLFFYLLLRPLLFKISTIVCINHEDFNFFSRYNKSTVLLPNWLFRNSSTVNVVERKKNMILFVGRNDSNKSPDYLLELPQNKYEIHCVTNDSTNLRNDFIIHNKLSDSELLKLYFQASLLVVPSRYEAFSYVVLEALNCGTPVLVSNRVRIVDHLQNVSGYTVFPYGDKSAFVASIDKAMNVKVNIDAIRNIFSEKKIQKSLYDIYKKVSSSQ